MIMTASTILEKLVNIYSHTENNVTLEKQMKHSHKYKEEHYMTIICKNTYKQQYFLDCQESVHFLQVKSCN